MGITGLIPFLEKASSKTNIKEFKGCTIAVDTYCWLHKGAYGCAEKLSRGENTNVHILYCLKFINMLLSFDIKPIMVFDGRHLPAKALTESRRRETRILAKKKAAELLRLGQIDEARVQMRRCIDITHEMVLDLIKECRKINVDCIVAPYEADAQLAYLNKKNIAQYVITEDSDLTLFGANKIIFKLDLTGSCLLVEANKLHLTMGCKPEKYTFDKFCRMCILSGCDYLDSLPGIGLAKSCKFILRTEETDMRRALKKLPLYLNMKSLTVSEDYIEEFLKAEATFKYMFVYDPFQRKMVRLNEISHDMKDYETICSNAGSLLKDEISFKLALGNLDPFTLKELDDWNPNNLHNTKNHNEFSAKSKHSSIWESNYRPHILKKQISMNVFTFKKVSYSCDNNVEKEIIDESDVVSLYTQTEPPFKKRRNFEHNINEENFDKLENANKHNPFMKMLSETTTDNCNSSNQLSSSLNNPTKMCNLERLSKFKRTVIDNSSKEIKSRLFTSNSLKTQNLTNSKVEKVSNETNNICNLEKILSTMNSNNDEELNIEKLYSPEKLNSVSEVKNINNSENNDVESNEIENQNSDYIINSFDFKTTRLSASSKELDIIEISDAEVILETESKNIPRKNLFRKKSTAKVKYDNSNSQTRLSMFGFQKKPTIQR